MFLKWFVFSAVSALSMTVVRGHESIPRDLARAEIVAEILKNFPEIKALATSKEAAPESKLSDLELYVDTFLPANRQKVTPDERTAARDGVLQQITRVIDSPLVRHGGLDRKQAAPYVIETIRVVVKVTHPEARKAVKPKLSKPAEEKPVHVSLVQSDQGKELMAKWKAAADYKTRRTVCEEIVQAGTEGARVIIELGRDAEVRKENSPTGMLSPCLERIGVAAKPAILEYLNLSEPTTGIDISRGIGAWPSNSIDDLIQSIDRDNEKSTTSCIYWIQNIAHRITPTETMRRFLHDALDHPSPRVRAVAIGEMNAMMPKDRGGYRNAWLTPPIERIVPSMQSPDAEVRRAAFQFLATTDRSEKVYAAAEKATFDPKEERTVRYYATQALAAHAPDDETLFDLAKRIEDPGVHMEVSFLRGLWYRPLPESFVPILCRWLVRSEDHYAGTNIAVEHLKKFGNAAIPSLVDTVARSDWDLVCKALSTLSQLTGGDSLIPDALRPRLGELASGGPRYNLDPVFTAIAKTFPSDEAMKLLRELGRHSEAGKLGLGPAIEAIGLIRPVSKDAIDFVRKSLQRPDEGLRYHAIQAVGKMGPDGAVLVPDLLDIIENDEKLRDRALYQIYEIKAVTSHADFQRLLRFADNKPINDYQTETAVIGRILSQEPKYFESVRQAWSDRPEMLLQLAVVRIDSRGNVIKLPPDLEERVFPLLVEQYLKRGPGSVQSALISIGKRDQRVIDEARRRVSEDDPSMAGQALILMAQLRPAEESERRLILDSLRSVELRLAAVSACGHLGSGAIEVLPQFMELAQNTGDWGRLNAIQAIGEIAPASPEVLGLLSRISEEPIPAIKSSADRALTRIAERHNQSD